MLKSIGTTLAPALSKNLTWLASINCFYGNGSGTSSPLFDSYYFDYHSFYWILENSSLHIFSSLIGWVRTPIIGFYYLARTWCPAPTMGECLNTSCLHWTSCSWIEQSILEKIVRLPINYLTYQVPHGVKEYLSPKRIKLSYMAQELLWRVPSHHSAASVLTLAEGMRIPTMHLMMRRGAGGWRSTQF